MQIVVVDMGVGNLQSVIQAMQTVAPDARVTISADPQSVLDADKVILPGQGAVGTWFRNLEQANLRQVIHDSLGQKPLLAICVGMQALFEYCEEDGGIDGLGVFKGSVRHFSNFHQDSINGATLKIPQMGWNQVAQTCDHPLWHGIDDDSYFYFVHSYCANVESVSDGDFIVGRADYGHEFIAAAAANKLFATQFHPEKSHDDGLRILKNFAAWKGE